MRVFQEGGSYTGQRVGLHRKAPCCCLPEAVSAIFFFNTLKYLLSRTKEKELKDEINVA